MGQKSSRARATSATWQQTVSVHEPIWWYNPHVSQSILACQHNVTIQFTCDPTDLDDPSRAPGIPPTRMHIRVTMAAPASATTPIIIRRTSLLGSKNNRRKLSMVPSSYSSDNEYMVQVDTIDRDHAPLLLHFPMINNTNGHIIHVYIVIATSLQTRASIGRPILVRIFVHSTPLPILLLEEELEAGVQAHICQLPNGSYIVTPPSDRRNDHAGVVMVDTASLRWLIFSAATHRSLSCSGDDTRTSHHIDVWYGMSYGAAATKPEPWSLRDGTTMYITHAIDGHHRIDLDINDREHTLHAQCIWLPSWRSQSCTSLIDHLPRVLADICMTYIGSVETCRFGDEYTITQLYRGIDILHVDAKDERRTDSDTIPPLVMRVYAHEWIALSVSDRYYYALIPQRHRLQFETLTQFMDYAAPVTTTTTTATATSSSLSSMLLPSSSMGTLLPEWLAVSDTMCITIQWTHFPSARRPSASSLFESTLSSLVLPPCMQLKAAHRHAWATSFCHERGQSSSSVWVFPISTELHAWLPSSSSSSSSHSSSSNSNNERLHGDDEYVTVTLLTDDAKDPHRPVACIQLANYRWDIARSGQPAACVMATMMPLNDHSMAIMFVPSPTPLAIDASAAPSESSPPSSSSSSRVYTLQWAILRQYEPCSVVMCQSN